MIRTLALLHRWLGIAGGVLFMLWFASGLVMLYARMPALDPEQRLLRLPPLDLSSVRVPPAEAASRDGLTPDRLRIGMLGSRPVYRFGQAGSWSTVFADDGRLLLGLSDAEALRLVIGYDQRCARTASHDRLLTVPDQWTLLQRALLPLHRVACGDRSGTTYYVSDRTGEVVLATTRSSRAWAYLGPVTHWAYFTPLRRNSDLWLRSLLVASFAGCLLALSGLAIGLARFSPRRRYRSRGETSRSPYAGLLRWHHYAGLIFGLVTFTWILSGGFSLEPFDWHSGTSPTKAQREAVAGGPLLLDALEPDRLRAALSVLETPRQPKELEVVQVDGASYLLAHEPPRSERGRPPKVDREPNDFLSPLQPLPRRLVSLDEPLRLRPAFEEELLVSLARRAMPDSEVTELAQLDRYDAYYHDRAHELPLPVLRVHFDDPQRTWLYLDPATGLVLRREERTSRLDRWLYHGLHSFDFPGLRERRPLWDAVVILLLLGGLLLSTTTLLPGLRRLRRHAARLVLRRPARADGALDTPRPLGSPRTRGR